MPSMTNVVTGPKAIYFVSFFVLPVHAHSGAPWCGLAGQNLMFLDLSNVT
jgi:hypothetical protein